MNLISFDGFSFQYPIGESRALKDIYLDVREGEFLVICGKSGSGKSTLLRCMKHAADEAVIMFQDPDTQLIHEHVVDDLAFYMENLGYDQDTMHRRMAETVSFFGMEKLLHENTKSLSGGQKQLVVLCGILMTRPKLLLLDEPIARLDPIAAGELLSMLWRINRELGIAVVLCEHRLDDVVTLADRIVLMDQGEIRFQGKTREMLKNILEDADGGKNTDDRKDADVRNGADDGFVQFVPSIARVSHLLNPGDEICLSSYELKNRTADIKTNLPLQPREKIEDLVQMELKSVFFAYPGSDRLVLRNMNLKVQKKERICMVGGNAAGKSTALKLMAGIIKPVSGSVKRGKNKIAYMPQDIRSFFRFETVRKEIEYSAGENANRQLLEEMGLSHLLERHPFDLSGGETEKLALYCLLAQNPDVILLDEPTNGLDPYAKQKMAMLLKTTEATVICVTHDLEFAADFATRCVMVFDGACGNTGAPADFFLDMDYYTTPLGRTFRRDGKGILTVKDVVKADV